MWIGIQALQYQPFVAIPKPRVQLIQLLEGWQCFSIFWQVYRPLYLLQLYQLISRLPRLLSTSFQLKLLQQLLLSLF
jgi:hypothetical protein